MKVGIFDFFHCFNSKQGFSISWDMRAMLRSMQHGVEQIIFTPTKAYVHTYVSHFA